MDNVQGKKIDKFFRQRLENWEQTPDPLAWEKLSEKLEQRKKPLWGRTGKYAAGVSVVFMLGLLFYWMLDWERKEQFTSEIVDINEIKTPDPSGPPVWDEALDSIEMEESVKVDILPSSTIPLISSKLPSANENKALRLKREESSKIKEEIPVIEFSRVELVEIDMPSLPVQETIFEDIAPEREVEYKVRIVSRGYAISPDKGDIIEQQVGKIGNFLTRVDQGFADLQDAKNDFFALTTTKKEK